MQKPYRKSTRVTTFELFSFIQELRMESKVMCFKQLEEIEKLKTQIQALNKNITEISAELYSDIKILKRNSKHEKESTLLHPTIQTEPTRVVS